MKDRLLPPCILNVDTRGVDTEGKGKDELDVRVIVDGVRSAVTFAFVGEGGKTKRVCEGAADNGGTEEELEEETVEETDLLLLCDVFRSRKAGGV